MDGSSSQPSDPNQTASGASKFLANLPSRGLFSSSTVVSSNPGGMRVYICEHNTLPPEGQQISTNQQNILIRSLLINSKRSDSGSSSKDSKVAADGPRKRAAERVLDSRAAAKKANLRAEGSNSRAAEKDLQNLTVERLRALLKEKGLSPKGKKDELIARLRSVNG